MYLCQMNFGSVDSTQAYKIYGAKLAASVKTLVLMQNQNVSLSKIVKIWEGLGIKDLTSIFALCQCAPVDSQSYTYE